MRGLAALILSLPVVALAGQSHSAHRRHARNAAARAPVRRGVQYKLEDDYSGQNFFDGFNFFTGQDPTSGQVTYLNQQDAMSQGLAFVQPDNTIKIGVDATTQLQPGQPRNSVRIQSNKSYNSGLFVADFYAMPHGCSVWPAYWTVGPDWPGGGEIDIIEGVNLNLQNQITLHTAENCVISDAIEAMTGHLVSPNCTSSPSANAGCAVTQNSNTTFGHGFNMQGGGAFVHLWDSQGIRVWFFPRGQIPQDITDGNPDPSTWGNPEANFPNNDSCNTAAGFHDHNIIIDTTLCGDWAGNAFSAPNSGCSGSCSDFVADPNNFKFAQWAIAGIKVYQQA